MAYIIAELSANHNHKLDNALRSVVAARKAGADAIKIQTYTADTITLDCDGDDFVLKGGLWDGSRRYDLYRQAYTPWEWHEEIFKVAREEGIDCFSTPFDPTAVDLLESLGTPVYKIASFEITDIPLISYIASKHKPVILSTGVATLGDVSLALETLRSSGAGEITLLKCTSEYPAPVSKANLRTMTDMRSRFGTRVGLSDHTLGSDVAVAAVALGADVIEKHFILDRSIGGPDSAFSMQADEFAAMVRSIRNVEAALGDVVWPEDPDSVPGRDSCRSLYVCADVKAGDVVTGENLRSVRPGFSLHPKYLPQMLGKRYRRDMSKGDRIALDDVM